MKRIFVSIFLLLFNSSFSSAQEGKKLIDIVNEIKAEQSGKPQKKTSIVRNTERTGIESETTRKKQESPRKELQNGKGETRSFNSYELIIRLLEGNGRFVSGHTSVKDFVHQREELTKSQHPIAIVLSCSDSRVPPELLFDESLGQLFVVRVAGNVVDSLALGSIEYAAEHLHTPLLIVLGHESCGAVAATLHGGVFPPNISSLVNRITPAVNHAKMELANTVNESELMNECVAENVREQAKQTEEQSEVLHELIERGEFAIVGAIYSLESGTVRFMQMKNTQPLSESKH